MSHFTVIVKVPKDYVVDGGIEAAIETMLAPYDEQPESDSPYLVWNDQTDEERTKWQTEGTERVRLPSGELCLPWDDRFRKPGMEGVIGAGTHVLPSGAEKIEVPFRETYPTFEAYELHTPPDEACPVAGGNEFYSDPDLLDAVAQLQRFVAIDRLRTSAYEAVEPILLGAAFDQLALNFASNSMSYARYKQGEGYVTDVTVRPEAMYSDYRLVGCEIDGLDEPVIFSLTIRYRDEERSVDVPLDYIRDSREERYRAIVAARRAAKDKAEAEGLAKKDAAERAEYERLKKKFEG